jgi:DNA-binding MarR family transcriptional regulator
MDRRPLPVDPIDVAVKHWESHGWQDAAPGMGVLTSVMRVQQIFAAEVAEVLRPFGLTFARYEVLMLLLFSRRGSLPLGTMGERLQVHPASVTNAVTRLEQDGLIRRLPNPSDGRSALAELTAKGRRLAVSATDSLNTQVFRSIALPADELPQVYGLLKALRRAAGDFT